MPTGIFPYRISKMQVFASEFTQCVIKVVITIWRFYMQIMTMGRWGVFFL